MTVVSDSRENFADQLITTILQKNSCVVVGLDPYFKFIPATIKEKFATSQKQGTEYASRVIREFNIQIIDLIARPARGHAGSAQDENQYAAFHGEPRFGLNKPGEHGFLLGDGQAESSSKPWSIPRRSGLPEHSGILHFSAELA